MFCVGRIWIVIRYFLFEKQAFNRLLKVNWYTTTFIRQYIIVFEGEP